MNEDVFARHWKQMCGELKSWWGKLADDDLDRIGGQKDKLIGLVVPMLNMAGDSGVRAAGLKLTVRCRRAEFFRSSGFQSV